jgi:hypothetical protein
MKPLRIYVSSDIDTTKAYGLFSQLEKFVKNGVFVQTKSAEDAHIAITNYPEDLSQKPKDVLHFPLYSSTAANFNVRLICPDDLVQKLQEYQQLLMRDQVIPRED